MAIFAEVGYRNKQTNEFVETDIRAAKVIAANGVSAEEHIADTDIHLTAEQINAVAGNAVNAESANLRQQISSAIDEAKTYSEGLVRDLETNLGTFVGSFNTKEEADAFVFPANVDSGDFCFITSDESQNGQTTRYICENDGTLKTWAFAYILNQNFSAGQMDSINSGVTADKVAAYDYAINNIDGMQALINRPDKWTPGIEYDFGDRLYGKRLKGNITAAAGGVSVLVVSNPGGTASSVSCGGWWTVSVNVVASFPGGTTSYLGFVITAPGSPALTFYSTTGNARTNAPYDVWFKYLKD